MPDSDAEQLEVLLTSVMRLLAMHGDAPGADHGESALSMAGSALLVELLTAGEATQQELADRLGVDKSRVSRVCAVLEREGLLVRRRDETNRRKLRLQITDSGAETAARLRQIWLDRHEPILAAMTPGERSALILGLGALARELTAFHRAHGTLREPPAG